MCSRATCAACFSRVERVAVQCLGVQHELAALGLVAGVAIDTLQFSAWGQAPLSEHPPQRCYTP
jgi:hypothetical protein